MAAAGGRGQFASMLLMVGPGNLLPLGVIVFAVLAIPPIIAARFGAYLARGRTVKSRKRLCD